MLGRLLILVLLAASCGGLGAGTAQADLYRLEGRYVCLGKPGALCYDATPSVARPPAPAAAAAARGEAGLPAPGERTQPLAAAGPRQDPVKPQDPLHAIVDRLQAGKPRAGDIDTLLQRTGSGDSEALELLAWCNATGTGVPRNSVVAYLLYGEAAAVGVANAARNQAAVYETSLTPEERQKALELENERRMVAVR
jgi:TPR repeat protein